MVWGVNLVTGCRSLAQKARWVNGGCGYQSPDLENSVPAICPRGEHHGEDRTLIIDEKTESQRGKLTSLRSPCLLELERSQIWLKSQDFQGSSQGEGKVKVRKADPSPSPIHPEEDLFSRGTWRGLRGWACDSGVRGDQGDMGLVHISICVLGP